MVNKPSNKPIKFTSVIGIATVLTWRFIEFNKKGVMSTEALEESLIILWGFVVIFYIGAMHPTLFAISKSLLWLAIDYARGKLSEEEVMERIKMILQQASHMFNTIFFRRQKKLKPTTKENGVE